LRSAEWITIKNAAAIFRRAVGHGPAQSRSRPGIDRIAARRKCRRPTRVQFFLRHTMPVFAATPRIRGEIRRRVDACAPYAVAPQADTAEQRYGP